MIGCVALAFLSGVFIGVEVTRGFYSDIGLEIKKLDREISADNLECAREERRNTALKVIAENERQASRN